MSNNSTVNKHSYNPNPGTQRFNRPLFPPLQSTVPTNSLPNMNRPINHINNFDARNMQNFPNTLNSNTFTPSPRAFSQESLKTRPNNTGIAQPLTRPIMRTGPPQSPYNAMSPRSNMATVNPPKMNLNLNQDYNSNYSQHGNASGEMTTENMYRPNRNVDQRPFGMNNNNNNLFQRSMGPNENDVNNLTEKLQNLSTPSTLRPNVFPAGFVNTPPLPRQPFNTPNVEGQNYNATSNYRRPNFTQRPELSGSPSTSYQRPSLMKQPNIPGAEEAQAARKLDPDAIPSAIKVIEEDRDVTNSPFKTSSIGTVPPKVTTDFSVVDEGVSSPRFIRSTLYCVPATNNLLNLCKVPFGVCISPMATATDAEISPPIVDTGTVGPVRCRCKSYMCTFMKFVDGGRKYSCPFCDTLNDVPQSDFAYLDYTGRRVDASSKPQYSLGTFEYTATAQYCIKEQLPKPPVYIFMIDVSYHEGAINIMDVISRRLKNEVLSVLPVENGDVSGVSKIQVAFVTYSDTIHFIDMNPKLRRPQLIVVSDIEDAFLPTSEGFFVTPREAVERIDYVFEWLKMIYSEKRMSKTILGPVIEAGIDALKSTGRVGKLIIIHTSLPTLLAPGKLKYRDSKPSAGDKVNFAPQTDYYTKLGEKCVAVGCSVDMYLCTMFASVDVATISQMVSKSGGKMYYYQDFSIHGNGEDCLINDLRRNVSKICGFNGVLRVRTSIGIRAIDFWGNFTMANANDVQIACIGPDDSISTEIKFDDKIDPDQPVYIQAAFLYTSISGRRLIRLINLKLKPTTQLIDVYKSCDMDTVIALFAKRAVYNVLTWTPVQIREMLIDACVNSLSSYRKHVSTTSSAGQLILPESMKLFPLYINCMIKSPAFINLPQTSNDIRSLAMFKIRGANVEQMQLFLYPSLIRIDGCLTNKKYHEGIRLSRERLESKGAYIIDNGVDLVFWLGLEVSCEWLYDIFTVNSVSQIDLNIKCLPCRDNENSSQLRHLIKQLDEKRGQSLSFTIVKEKGENEIMFNRLMFEDQGPLATSSYIDFLCQIHKQIRDKLKN